jgi:hypothetical protein
MHTTLLLSSRDIQFYFFLFYFFFAVSFIILYLVHHSAHILFEMIFIYFPPVTIPFQETSASQRME